MSIHSSAFNQVRLRRSQIFIEILFIVNDKAPAELKTANYANSHKLICENLCNLWL